MEQVAEALKKAKESLSEEQWKSMIENLSESTRNIFFCLPFEIESVIDSIISVYG